MAALFRFAADQGSLYLPGMCGRYASFLPAEALSRMFRTVNPLLNLEPSWNVAPTQSAPVVRRHPETDERHLDLLKWGLLRWLQKDTRRPHLSHGTFTGTTLMLLKGEPLINFVLTTV